MLASNYFPEQGESSGGSELNDEGKLESLTPANFILGFGKINNKQVVVGGEDFTVKGGSPNSAGLRKSVYTEELALKYKIPLIRLHEGGGGSVAGPGKKSGGYGGDPVFSKSRFKSIADTLREIPVASAALGPVAGMPAARFVGSHFRVMTKETAQILVAGPAVVERACGKKMYKEGLGGSESHTVKGVTDKVTTKEQDASRQIKKFLSYFPQNKYEITEKLDCDDPIERMEEDLLSIIPKDRKRSYEMRDIVKLIFDKDSFFEMTRYYGRGIITGFARINGYAVAIFANDSNFYAGSMSAEGAQKTTRFIRLCDTFNIPIVSLVDEPGFIIVPDAEKAGTSVNDTEAEVANTK